MRIPREPLWWTASSSLALVQLASLVGLWVFAARHRAETGRDGTGRLGNFGARTVVVGNVLVAAVAPLMRVSPLACIGILCAIGLAVTVGYWVVVWAVWRSPGGWIVGRTAFVSLGTLAVVSGDRARELLAGSGMALARLPEAGGELRLLADGPKPGKSNAQ